LDRLDDDLLTQLHRAGLRAINFGVEAVSAETLRRVGRRPIPESQQRIVIESCSRRGIETSAFYVFGFVRDDWNSISATVGYAIDLGSTFAQSKLLTPYPGTSLWKQLSPLVSDTDWEKLDGFTPTFTHPKLTAEELKFLLGAAYSRFYIRPSWAANYLRIRNRRLRGCRSSHI
jgi:anaerobic magnesium-protoporphyrin IX monomethyl ester cyclase